MLLLDLFCGRGGWTRQALTRRWSAIGYDIQDHGYPAPLFTQALPVPIAELLAMQPDLVVASPPCEAYARSSLPWINNPADVPGAKVLLDWSISLIGQFPCPVIVECSRFAARYSAVPPAAQVGPYYLWGNVPALFPQVMHRKSRLSGTDPARRAMIDASLAEWLIAQAEL